MDELLAQSALSGFLDNEETGQHRDAVLCLSALRGQRDTALSPFGCINATCPTIRLPLSATQEAGG